MTRQIFPDACGRQSDHGSNHRMEDAAPDDCDTLPCYESLGDLPPAAAPTPPEPTDDSKGSDRASAQQGHSCTLMSEYFDQYDQGFEFKMAPIHPTLNLDILDSPTRYWVAILCVKTRDVPRLMREGFFWSTENVVPEEGYMSSETRREWTDQGLRHRRTWMLADKSNDEAPRWVGRLDVISLSRRILPGFRLQNLSRGNVYAARAWIAHRQIYNWDCRWADEYNYNCIYDDTPLRGWWPWPREEGTYVGFSAPEMDLFEASEPAEEPPASYYQPHERHESHGPDQQSSGCVIL
jgi:hypothetical protein